MYFLKVLVLVVLLSEAALSVPAGGQENSGTETQAKLAKGARAGTLIERIEGPRKRQYSSSYSTLYGSHAPGYSSDYHGKSSYVGTYSSSHAAYAPGYSSDYYGFSSYVSSYSSSHAAYAPGYSSDYHGKSSYVSTYSSSHASYAPGYSSDYHGMGSYVSTYSSSYGSYYHMPYGEYYLGWNMYGSSNSGYHGSSVYGNYDNGYGSSGYINDGSKSGSGSHQGHTKQFGKGAIKYVLGLLGDLLNEAVDNEYGQHHEHDRNERCREVQGSLPYDESYMYHDSDGQMQMFVKMGETLKNLATRINDCSGVEVLSMIKVDNLIDMALTAYQLEPGPVDQYVGIAELEAAYNTEKDYALGTYGSVWPLECYSDITAYDCNMEQLHEKMVMSMQKK